MNHTNIEFRRTIIIRLSLKTFAYDILKQIEMRV